MVIQGPEDFTGRWQLQRRLTDAQGGLMGTVTGQVTFTPMAPDLLQYDEDGSLQLASGPAMMAKRRYLWTFDAAGVAVAFDDGRPFHRFVPSGHAAGTDHPCGDDLYLVRYDFTQWPRWTAVWTVTGPRKAYVSTSVLVR